MQAKEPVLCSGCGEKFHGFTSCDIDRMKANIAKQRKLEKAAPDLLAALKVAKQFFINPGSFNPLDVERIYDAAIARAEEV